LLSTRAYLGKSNKEELRAVMVTLYLTFFVYRNEKEREREREGGERGEEGRRGERNSKKFNENADESSSLRRTDADSAAIIAEKRVDMMGYDGKKN